MKDKATIRSDWRVSIILAPLCVLIAILHWETRRENPNICEDLLVAIVLAAGFVCIVKHLISYRLDSEQIACRLFGITYRKIIWRDIQQIGIACTSAKQRPGSNHLYVLVVLRGCPDFDPDGDAARFTFLHPRKTLKLNIRKDGILILEKYYGALDFGKDLIPL